MSFSHCFSSLKYSFLTQPITPFSMAGLVSQFLLALLSCILYRQNHGAVFHITAVHRPLFSPDISYLNPVSTLSLCSIA